MPEILISTHTVSAKTGGRASVSDSLADSLIQAIRRIIFIEMPEVTSIVEGIPSARLLTEIQLPFACIIVGPPSEVSDAPNRSAFISVPVEVVVLRKERADSATDNPEALRATLNPLSVAFLTGHAMEGNAMTTELVATPHERTNEYQEHFANLNQPVTVLVVTINCIVEVQA